MSSEIESGYLYRYYQSQSEFSLELSINDYKIRKSSVWCALFNCRNGSCFNVTWGKRDVGPEIDFATALKMAKGYLHDNFRKGPRVRFIQAVVPFSAKEKGW